MSLEPFSIYKDELTKAQKELTSGSPSLSSDTDWARCLQKHCSDMLLVSGDQDFNIPPLLRYPCYYTHLSE